MDKLITHRGTALGWPPARRGVGLHVAERRQYTASYHGHGDSAPVCARDLSLRGTPRSAIHGRRRVSRPQLRGHELHGSVYLDLAAHRCAHGGGRDIHDEANLFEAVRTLFSHRPSRYWVPVGVRLLTSQYAS